MDFKKAIVDTFGKERGALLEAEIQHLIGKGHSQKDLVAFLEKYALSTGVFYTLSMFRRANLTVKGMERSMTFLFNSFPMLSEEFSKYVPHNGRILDFGCGRGLISCSLALKGFEVHGVDISNENLEVAKKLADKMRCRATFHLIKKGKLPFKDRYFDMAFSHWTFHEVQEDQQPIVVAELCRILRDKGYAFIIDQEKVVSFATIKGLMNQHGFELELEKGLAPVYDHGKVSQAIMLVYRKS